MAVINSFNILATGGGIMLFFTTAKTGNMTITRTRQSDNAVRTIYSGPVLRYDGLQAIFLDVGDDDTTSALAAPGTQLSALLDPAELYVYVITDNVGTAHTLPLQPSAGALITGPDYFPVILKLLQSALQTMTLPPGIARAFVSFAPPEATFPTLPFITIFPSKLTQSDQPIGRSVELVDEQNYWTIYEQAVHEVTISMFFRNAQELVVYQEKTISLVKFIISECLSPLGADSVHFYTSESYMEIKQGDSKAPSFLRCDIKLQFKAEYNCAVKRDWGVIDHIDFEGDDEVTGDDQINFEIP